MSAAVFDHPQPDRFIPGTVGLPGERTFYLQAKSGQTVTSVRLEKEQVEMLGERIDELLDMVRAKTGNLAQIPATYIDSYVDNAGLTMPVDPEFSVGTMTLGWDTSRNLLLIECFELTQADAEAGISAEPDEDDDDDRQVLRVSLSAAQAREFARRAEQLVNAGRGDCPFCSLPLEADGHLCPRANGIPR